MTIQFLVLLAWRFFPTFTKEIEQWDQFELELQGPSSGNPFLDVSLTGNFSINSDPNDFQVHGFYDGNGIYKIRFMPNKIGLWAYKTYSNIKSMDNIKGNFTCVQPKNPTINQGTNQKL